MLESVFWDNDGVLVDTEALYYQATREVLASAGGRLTKRQFLRISLGQGKSLFSLAKEQGLSQLSVLQLQEERNARYSELLRKNVRIMDGVEETLRRLQGRVSMGIVTGSRRDHFEIIHNSTDLLQYFDFVLTREDYEEAKPAPDSYLTAMVRKGVSPERCLVVEDSERGFKAARNAYIRCLVVPNTFTSEGDFCGAYKILDSIREVPSEVLKLQ